MKMLSRLLPLVLTFGLEACAEGCDLISIPGIRVTLVDETTGSPLQGDVTVVATEGSYIDSIQPAVRPGEPRIAFLAFDRPGTYHVEAQAPGYVNWVATTVRVTMGDCHVETVDLTAELIAGGTD